MRELVRTNNAVLVSAIDALLKGADIPHQVLDQHMSVLEGSLGILPRRILVDDERRDEARTFWRMLVSPTSCVHCRAVRTGDHRRRRARRPLATATATTRSPIGHDAILLAASTGARSGDHVVDLGAGVGAAGLALAMRIPDATVTLVEIDPVIAALATENIERNGLGERARVVVLDVTAPSEAFAAARLGPGSADRVMMNPPFNDPARQNASPDAQRRTAHVAEPNLLSDWIAAASWLLHSAGTLTMIWRADGLSEVLAALAPRFGAVAILPVHGSAGQPAIRAIVRASKTSRAPLVLLPGLVLNDASGRPTAEAERVLRHAETLALAEV